MNELIDKQVIAELSDTMGADFAAELITTFLDDAPSLFAALTAAISDQNADVFRRAAHSIKSNAQVFGAVTLTNLAREMEMGDLPDSMSSVAELQASFEQTAAALRGHLDE